MKKQNYPKGRRSRPVAVSRAASLKGWRTRKKNAAARARLNEGRQP